MNEPGALMRAEIAEQPELWARQLHRRAEIARLARALGRPRFVLLAARGTSDHAALYGKYLVEIRLGLPAGLVSPSTLTAYAARPDWRDVLLLAVSQSGASPDLVATVDAANRAGATTLALTNQPDSPLARAAAHHLAIGAGPERAVAATKSYTAQLLALFLLVDALAGHATSLDSLAGLGRDVLAAAGAAVPAHAARYRFAQRMIVTGRGYAYPTAREAALKLMETSYVSAQAFSGADLLHGPVAILDREIPVLAIVPEGPAGAAMAEIIPRIRAAGADLFTVGGPATDLPLPTPPDDALAPLLEIVPFQLLALHLATARGIDPDAPRALRKVTETL